ncbi:MAG: hypothetical protein ACK5AL_06025 [Planctomycetota bacterium]|jgi:hypothetical protein
MIKLDLHPTPRVLQQFAFLALPGLALLAWLALRLLGAFGAIAAPASPWTHPAVLAAAGVGALQLALYFAGRREPSRWVYVGLMLVAYPIGLVVSTVLIAVIFYALITPIGLVFRAIGRDVMGRRPDRSLPTYWHDRGAPRPAASYFKLY